MKIEAGQTVYFYSKWGQHPAIVETVNPREQTARIRVLFAGKERWKTAHYKNLKPIEPKGSTDDHR